jgi:hypothetical protein
MRHRSPRRRRLTATAMTAIAMILDQAVRVAVTERGAWDLLLLFREDGTRRTRWMRAAATISVLTMSGFQKKQRRMHPTL